MVRSILYYGVISKNTRSFAFEMPIRETKKEMNNVFILLSPLLRDAGLQALSVSSPVPSLFGHRPYCPPPRPLLRDGPPPCRVRPPKRADFPPAGMVLPSLGLGIAETIHT